MESSLIGSGNRQIDLDSSTNSVFSEVPSLNNAVTAPRWQVLEIVILKAIIRLWKKNNIFNIFIRSIWPVLSSVQAAKTLERL